MEIFGLRKCFCGSRNIDYVIYGFTGHVNCQACDRESPSINLWPGESSTEFRERVRRTWNEHITGMFSTCTALVTMNHLVVHESATIEEEVFVNEEADQFATEQKLAEVIERKEKVRFALNRIMKRLADFNSVMERENRYILAEKREIEAEIAKLTAAIHDKRVEARHERDDLDQEFADWEPDGGAEFQEQEPEPEPETESEARYEREEQDNRVVASAKVKKLFRRIANKTHPDKTDDPEYHQLFRTAKQYYKENDYDGLQEIWNYITGTISRFLSKILKRLQQEVEELRNVERQLANVRSSNDYQLLGLFEAKREVVLMQVRMQLNYKVEQLRAHLQMLRNVAGIKPDPVDVFFNFEC